MGNLREETYLVLIEFLLFLMFKLLHCHFSLHDVPLFDIPEYGPRQQECCHEIDHLCPPGEQRRGCHNYLQCIFIAGDAVVRGEAVHPQRIGSRRQVGVFDIVVVVEVLPLLVEAFQLVGNVIGQQRTIVQVRHPQGKRVLVV